MFWQIVYFHDICGTVLLVTHHYTVQYVPYWYGTTWPPLKNEKKWEGISLCPSILMIITGLGPRTVRSGPRRRRRSSVPYTVYVHASAGGTIHRQDTRVLARSSML